MIVIIIIEKAAEKQRAFLLPENTIWLLFLLYLQCHDQEL